MPTFSWQYLTLNIGTAITSVLLNLQAILKQPSHTTCLRSTHTYQPSHSSPQLLDRYRHHIKEEKITNGDHFVILHTKILCLQNSHLSKSITYISSEI